MRKPQTSSAAAPNRFRNISVPEIADAPAAAARGVDGL
jgi:hypothetical protein